MALYNPPPPLLTTAGTTDFNNGAAAASSNIISPQEEHHSSSSFSSSSPASSSTSTSTSIIIVIIVIASAIIVSASIYLLLRFLSRRCSRSVLAFPSADDVVPDRRTENNEARHQHHVICFDSGKVESLPLFTFSSLTGNIAGGDCAVCLSRFEAVDQLRLLPLCCHAFHAECIDAWLKSNQTCPLCRSTVNPTEEDVRNKILSVSGDGDRSNSFRIEIGSVSRRRTPSDSGRRSYSIGSYDYVLDDGYEVPVESTHRREASDCTSGDKDSTPPVPPGENLTPEIGGGSGRLNWLRDYVDRVSVSISSRSHSGRFFAGSSRRSEAVDDFEATHGRAGEEISELFRWLSGV